MTFSHAKQICSLAHLTPLLVWWMTNSQFKQSHFRSIRLFRTGIYFFFRFTGSYFWDASCGGAVCFHHLRAGVSRQSWGFTQQEAGMEKWQQHLHIPVREVEISLCLSCMLSGQCPRVELLRTVILPHRSSIGYLYEKKMNWVNGQ